MDYVVFQQPLLFPPRFSIIQSFNNINNNNSKICNPPGFSFGGGRHFYYRQTVPSVGFHGESSSSDESSSSTVSNYSNNFNFSDKSSSSSTVGNDDAQLINNPRTSNFFVSDAEGDPDCPTEGFSSIEHALHTLRQGKFVIVVVDDDENGKVEGNLVMAASHVSSEDVAFMVKHGSGIVSVGMRGEDLERLKLPLISHQNEDNPSAPSFTITVDVRIGTTTGVSFSDRAKTILALSSLSSKPEDFIRPGHVFPLKYRDGGVLRRAGHTEASVDLVMLAGLQPTSVFSIVVDKENGSIATMVGLRELGSNRDIPIVSIADLIRYRRKREKLVERAAVSRLPTKWGLFQAYCYRSKIDGIEHIALVKGEIGNGQDILVRVHSECLTGDIFGSKRCDCGPQLDLALQLIEEAGRGVVIYLRGHEGRGIGLGHKLQAYNLQDDGHDTVEANLELGFAADARDYGIGAQMLQDLGVQTMRLMTNNPAKFVGLKGYGLAVIGRVPVLTPINDENRKYLETKRRKMGHVYKSDIHGPLDEYIINPNEIP